MAQKITRTITRETPDVDPCYHETLMIRLEPGSKCLKIWQKGSRSPFAIRFADIFRLGYQAAVVAAQGNRLKKRQQPTKGR